jgi:hypothetical protein
MLPPLLVDDDPIMMANKTMPPWLTKLRIALLFLDIILFLTG